MLATMPQAPSPAEIDYLRRQLQQLLAQLEPGALVPFAVLAADATGRHAAAILQRLYHMGAKPTPGKDYDDRLPARLELCPATVYKYLKLPILRGGIRHRRVGKKYQITERAVQEWYGDLPAA
jgi:hypothetical protein